MLSWIRRYGWLLLFSGGAILFYFLKVGRARPPIGEIKAEVDALRAEGRTERLEAKRGRAVALDEIAIRYSNELAKLQADELEDYVKLKANPSRLARRLARIRSRAG